MSKNKYNFKQAELYTICRFILSALSVPEVLARFAAFKGKYTMPWITARQLEVDQAEDAPAEQQRNAVHETLRIELLALVQNALNTFSALERYIAEVIPPELQKPAIEAAGGTFYAAASDSDFDACQQMLNAASIYATDNATTLEQAGQNMPAAFPAQVASLLATFEAKHSDFIASEGSAEVLTEQKIALNNGIYANIVQAVNADAQAIYTEDDEEAIRNQFVLEHQLYLVRGAGVAGMRFHVTDAATGLDVADVLITIPAKAVSLTTDAAGRALKLQLAEGEYEVKAIKAGYVEWKQTIKIETGTVKRVNIALAS
ncbi:MAG: carboxypeptidase regulatory-like domain-containing protein [Bacteroidetes bacterium]|nr:carboxypeptidase regulatory-like domain-containing protein [Bacteroidota bacterium]